MFKKEGNSLEGCSLSPLYHIFKKNQMNECYLAEVAQQGKIQLPPTLKFKGTEKGGSLQNGTGKDKRIM